MYNDNYNFWVIVAWFFICLFVISYRYCCLSLQKWTAYLNFMGSDSNLWRPQKLYVTEKINNDEMTKFYLLINVTI
jgi:hypothetical protein